MLRRAPTTTDGKLVDRLQESCRVTKPFKPPTLIVQRVQPQRKRKRVSYKGADTGKDESESEDEGGKKKKKKTGKDGFEMPRDNNIQEYPVFQAKPFEEIARKFSIPAIRNSEGEYVHKASSNIALGIRPLANLIPRPLHDPMEDHAIVLYDPTIDAKETDEERKEREKEEEKERLAQEAAEKYNGLYNPHKSLKQLLGGGKDKKSKVEKVAVVIDPRLTKVLRPHQVEGVKVSFRPLSSVTSLMFYLVLI
jgi:DNA repair and recombination protein RAD54 and RAD54-like protein